MAILVTPSVFASKLWRESRHKKIFFLILWLVQDVRAGILTMVLMSNKQTRYQVNTYILLNVKDI